MIAICIDFLTLLMDFIRKTHFISNKLLSIVELNHSKPANFSQLIVITIKSFLCKQILFSSSLDNFVWTRDFITRCHYKSTEDNVTFPNYLSMFLNYIAL